MADEYIRKQDAIDEINTNADDLEQNGGIPFAQGARAMAIVVEQMPSADVVSVSAYNQVMLEMDTAGWIIAILCMMLIERIRGNKDD